MLSNNEHPGVFAFLVGLIVLVMLAVGLSLMVDRRFSFSSRASGLERDVAAGEAELDRLKAIRQQGEGELAEAEPLFRMVSAHNATQRRLLVLGRQKTNLLASIDTLQNEIRALDGEFSRYRKGYRDTIRAAARGEVLGNITISGGRELRGAVIVEVTGVGLEIRHEHGTARLRSPDLDPALQERFQWSDEELNARLGEERAIFEAFAPTGESKGSKVSDAVKSSRSNRQSGGVDSDKLDTLRRKVSAWKSKVARLNSERNAALNSASYGSQSSVPGSLETWQGRAARIGMELAKARAELAASRLELSKVAPSDPLLRQESERP